MPLKWKGVSVIMETYLFNDTYKQKRKFVGNSMDNQNTNNQSTGNQNASDPSIDNPSTGNQGEWTFDTIWGILRNVRLKTAKKVIVVIFSLLAVILKAHSYYTEVNANLKSLNKSIAAIDTKVDDSLSKLEENLDSRMGHIESSIEDIKEDINNLTDDVNSIDERVSALEGSVYYSSVSYMAASSLIDSLHNMSYGYPDTSLSKSDILAIDEITNDTYTLDQLCGKRVLLNYSEDGLDNLFYGQINENGHWDGDCTINSYKDGFLYYISDSTYDDGQLIKYNQVFKSVTNIPQEGTSNIPIWIVSSRLHNSVNDSNIGISRGYYRNADIKQDFDIHDAHPYDVVGSGGFVKENAERLISYYYGVTKDGEYNDDSGQAYLAKYDSDGKIAFLYKGNFVDGKPNDTSGKAWYISWGGTAYVRYKGAVVNGVRVSDDNLKQFSSDDELLEFIAKNQFKCELYWHSLDET